MQRAYETDVCKEKKKWKFMREEKKENKFW